LKIETRSIPRKIMWCSAPGASKRALRGITTQYPRRFRKSIYFLMSVPPHSIIESIGFILFIDGRPLNPPCWFINRTALILFIY
jgi:hypothetical protein